MLGDETQHGVEHERGVVGVGSFLAGVYMVGASRASPATTIVARGALCRSTGPKSSSGINGGSS